MKHSRVSITDYEPRMAALEAENRALRASNAQLETAALDLLTRLQEVERITQAFQWAMAKAVEQAGAQS